MKIVLGIMAMIAMPILQVPSGTKPSFEVASVKAYVSGDSSLGTTPSRFLATGIPLRMLLREAFTLFDAQIVGAPSWFNTDRWDVEAKAITSDVPQAQMMEMVQSLLEDR